MNRPKKVETKKKRRPEMFGSFHSNISHDRLLPGIKSRYRARTVHVQSNFRTSDDTIGTVITTSIMTKSGPAVRFDIVAEAPKQHRFGKPSSFVAEARSYVGHQHHTSFVTSHEGAESVYASLGVTLRAHDELEKLVEKIGALPTDEKHGQEEEMTGC